MEIQFKCAFEERGHYKQTFFFYSLNGVIENKFMNFINLWMTKKKNFFKPTFLLLGGMIYKTFKVIFIFI